MNSMKKWVGIQLILISVVACFEAWAEFRISSEYFLNIDKNILSDTALDSHRELNRTGRLERDYEVFEKDQIPVEVSGLAVDYQYSLSLPSTLPLGSDFYIQTSKLSVQVKINEIKIDHEIVEESGNVRFVTRINAHCKGIHLQTSSAAPRASALIRIVAEDGNLTASVPWLQFDWDPEKIFIEVDECKGAEGFQPIIERQLKGLAQSNQALISEVKEQILDKMKELTDELNQSLLEPITFDSRPNQVTSFFPERITVTPQGDLGIYGIFQANFLKVYPGEVQYKDVSFNEFVENEIGTKLVFPFSLVSHLIDASYKNGDFKKDIDGDEISGFRSLKDSWLTKSFVWPDLLNYHKNARFVFKSMVDRRPEFFGWATDGDSHPQAKYRLSLKAEVWGEKKIHGLVHSLTYKTELSGLMSLSVQSDHLMLSSHRPEMNRLKAEWNSEYLERFPSYDDIAIGTIEDRMRESLAPFEYKLIKVPAFKVYQEIDIKMHDIKQQENLLVIPLQLYQRRH